MTATPWVAAVAVLGLLLGLLLVLGGRGLRLRGADRLARPGDAHLPPLRAYGADGPADPPRGHGHRGGMEFMDVMHLVPQVGE